MPEISRFYGIIIYLNYGDHNPPHIHVDYSGHEAVFEIPSGRLLDGKLPARARKLVTHWISLHQDELLANWKFAEEYKPTFKITPLP
jgi:Domain of unknown function (DUF4160)